MAHSLIIIKPDAVEKGVAEEIFKLIEGAGFKITHKQEPIQLDKETVEEHYTAHRGKPFFDYVVDFMTSGTAIPAIVSGGPEVVADLRKLVGHTIPSEAEKGTIRATFSDDTRDRAEAEGRAIHNVIHASGNKEEAEAEIKLWFPEVDLNPQPAGGRAVPKKGAAMRFDV